MPLMNAGTVEFSKNVCGVHIPKAESLPRPAGGSPNAIANSNEQRHSGRPLSPSNRKGPGLTPGPYFMTEVDSALKVGGHLVGISRLSTSGIFRNLPDLALKNGAGDRN